MSVVESCNSLIARFLFYFLERVNTLRTILSNGNATQVINAINVFKI
jgi:hypothetical protein